MQHYNAPPGEKKGKRATVQGDSSTRTLVSKDSQLVHKKQKPKSDFTLGFLDTKEIVQDVEKKAEDVQNVRMKRQGRTMTINQNTPAGKMKLRGSLKSMQTEQFKQDYGTSKFGTQSSQIVIKEEEDDKKPDLNEIDSDESPKHYETRQKPISPRVEMVSKKKNIVIEQDSTTKV